MTMTVHLVDDKGLPLPGVAGLYAVRVGESLVKFGHSRNLASRLVSHHRSLRHLGCGFIAAYIERADSSVAERDLLARLDRAGFERSPSSEAFTIAWPVALRFLAASAQRGAT
jgi:hypothetical protein